MIKKIDKKYFTVGMLLFAALVLSACSYDLGDVAEVKRNNGLTLADGSAREWRDEVIYQVLVDRFADGDPSNTYNIGTDPNELTGWMGGDWQGLIDKVDYLKKLGVTALWISPAVKNVEEDAGISGYHGYWTQDYVATNPHFGDIAKMREMVDVMHDNGIKIILDIVANHVGQLFYYDINGNGSPGEAIEGTVSKDFHCGLGESESNDNYYRATCKNILGNPFTSDMCNDEYKMPDEYYNMVTKKEKNPKYDDYSRRCPDASNLCECICRIRCHDEGFPSFSALRRYTEWDPDSKILFIYFFYHYSLLN